MAVKDALRPYRAKRNFSATPEPAEGGQGTRGQLSFVIQKHWASRLHYDFRLELDGSMKSWAVPKGPSFDSHDKRMAVQVEDHPISYSSFEGVIPKGQYGAGKVIIWDKGSWEPVGDPHQGYREGDLKFELHGVKLRGRWVLVRMKGRGEKQQPWLLIKEKDAFVRSASEFSVVDEMPDSVKSAPMPGRSGKSEKAEAKRGARSSASTGEANPGATLPTGVRKAGLPDKLPPQLATLLDGPPKDPASWLFEIKFDGYRLLTRIKGSDIRLVTRNGNDWTSRLKPLQEELARMKLPDGWYDGEIVVLNAAGIPDFGALQLSFDSARTQDIVYYLFDMPYFDGYDLREVALESRRGLLQQLLASIASERVKFSQAFDTDADSILSSACALGLEGVIAKRRDSAYQSRRSPHWVKLKCSQRQEFVIGGYTDPRGARAGIGSLLLGVHDAKGALHYAGNVGTGFSDDLLRDLRQQFERLGRARTPFDDTKGIVGKPHWVEPELVAEVSFGEWTSAGRIRHSVFHGLRSDKPARAVVREKAAKAARLPHASATAADSSAMTKRSKGTTTKGEAAMTEATQTDATVGGARGITKPGASGPITHSLSTRVRVTNPERVIDTSTGITKIELVRYYDLVGELMMAHLKNRPVALVRAPSGIGGELFFQKHAETDKLPGVRQLDPALWMGHPAMLEIAGKQGLLSAAQWNVVEVHTLNTSTRSFEHADRLVFDLDPGEGVAWNSMQQATELVHSMLDQLGLTAFLKTSGGKGLHVVVPIRKSHDWDTVKGFSQAVVEHLASTIPQLFVAKSGPRNRVGKIFVDYLRNGVGASTVSAWSARARPGMGISVPVRWDELGTLKGGNHWTIRSAHSRLDEGNAPWDGYARSARSLNAAMKKLGYDSAKRRP